jgi:inosine-uridine nucleoside N-ribohydrolase
MPLPAVLDTDTYNEVDDQFALAHLLLSPEAVDLQAVYAAPILYPRSESPADGMEKSYREIHCVLDLVAPAVPPQVFRGSAQFLPGAHTPVASDAAADLVQRAMAMPEGQQLCVVAIAAITNVASALLAEPRIAGKIRVIWLGGHAPYWPHTREFNLMQDIHASRVLLDGAAPLELIPCFPVASHLQTTVAELEAELAPHSRLGRYLTDIVRDYNAAACPAWSKVIWDIAASARLLCPEWAPAVAAPGPVLEGTCAQELRWQHPAPETRREITLVQSVHRDAIFADFFAKCRALGASTGG